MQQPVKDGNVTETTPEANGAAASQITLTLERGKYQLTPDQMQELIEQAEHIGLHQIGQALVRLTFMGDITKLDEEQRAALFQFQETILYMGRMTW